MGGKGLICALVFAASALAWASSSTTLNINRSRISIEDITQRISSSMASTRLFQSQRTIPTKDERLEQIYNESVWKNDLILWIIPSTFRDQLPHMVQVSFIILFDLLGRPLPPRPATHTVSLNIYLTSLSSVLYRVG